MDEYWIEQEDGSLAPESAILEFQKGKSEHSLAPESAILEFQKGKSEHSFRSMGKNVQIAPTVFFAHPELVDIGDNVRIDGFCSFTASMKIGNFVHIGPFVSVIGGGGSKLVMEDFSGLSAGCRMVCGSDNYFEELSNPMIPLAFRSRCVQGTVHLSRHCIAGTNTVVHPNVRFNEGACTGSSSLVTHDLREEWMVYIGAPATPFKKRNKAGILLDEARFLLWRKAT